MDNQCYYYEQIFESNEKLYEHLIVHSNPKKELKNKVIPKKLARQRQKKRNKLIPVLNETNVKTNLFHMKTEKPLHENVELRDQILRTSKEIHKKRSNR